MSASFSVQEVPLVLRLIHTSRIRWKYPRCPHAAGVYAGEVTVIGIINGFYARNGKREKETVDECRFTAGWKSPLASFFHASFPCFDSRSGFR